MCNGLFQYVLGVLKMSACVEDGESVRSTSPRKVSKLRHHLAMIKQENRLFRKKNAQFLMSYCENNMIAEVFLRFLGEKLD